MHKFFAKDEFQRLNAHERLNEGIVFYVSLIVSHLSGNVLKKQVINFT